jgi:GxxExxY protein
LLVERQHAIDVFYKGVSVGFFSADLLIERCLVIESKAVKNVTDAHVALCLNYLRATGLSVCLLLNFQPAHVSVKRIVSAF